MSELKPCPFCGGEAFVRIDVALNPTQARYNVGCDKNSYCHGWYGHSRYYNTEAEAAAAWNTRHVETCRITSKGEPEYDVITRDYEFSCGHTIAWGHVYEPNYCPNCGRRVEG